MLFDTIQVKYAIWEHYLNYNPNKLLFKLYLNFTINCPLSFTLIEIFPSRDSLA